MSTIPPPLTPAFVQAVGRAFAATPLVVRPDVDYFDQQGVDPATARHLLNLFPESPEFARGVATVVKMLLDLSVQADKQGDSPEQILTTTIATMLPLYGTAMRVLQLQPRSHD